MSSPSIHPAELLRALLFALPFSAAAIVGLLLAISRWRQHPRPALLTALACGILLCVTLSSAMANVLGSVLCNRLGITPQFYYTVSGILWTLLHTLSMILLLVAVFIDRSPRPANP